MARPSGLARSDGRDLSSSFSHDRYNLPYIVIRGGKIGQTQWASSVRPIVFFALKRLFNPTSPGFRADWPVKILARKNRVNFSLAHCWPGPTRLGRLPPLIITKK